MKNYRFSQIFLLILVIGMTTFISCQKEIPYPEKTTPYSELESRTRGAAPSLDCIITPGNDPINLQAGASITLTGSPGSFPGAVSYSWSVSNTNCIQIVGSSNNSSVTIQAVGGFGCTAQVDLVVTEVNGSRTSTCNTEIDVEFDSGSCCFDFWEVPKWFPICYGDCTGNLDHIVEIHHQLCNNLQLPSGYTTRIHNVQLFSNTSFGNCASCANPVTNFPHQGHSSFNLAICGPLNHSMLLDIAIRDQNGNIVYICEDNYFSFAIPECDNGGF